MAKLFSYGDREGQAIHLSRYLKRTVNLFTPGDREVQPIYLQFPNFPDACFLLQLLPNVAVTLLIAADALYQLSVNADASVTIDDRGIPDFVVNVELDASFILNVADCEDG